MDFAKRWNNHLRRVWRKTPDNIQCPLCGHGLPGPDTAQNGGFEAAFATFEIHFADSHAEVLDAKESEEEKTEAIRLQWQAALTSGDRFVAAPAFSLVTATNTTDQGG
jgi:hypothetical protein